MDPVWTSIAMPAFQAASRGDVAAAHRARAAVAGSVEGSSVEARAWTLALDSAVAFATGSSPFPPAAHLEALTRVSGANQVPLVLAAHQIGRAAAVRGDLAELDAVGRTLADIGRTEHVFSGPAYACLRAWAAWARHRDPPDDAELQAAGDRARELGLPGLVVELVALRALLAEARGEDDGALRLARRAVHMARAESLPQEICFAGVVLARQRRRRGASHLATKIARALAEAATAPWLPWIRWEAAMAGDPDLPNHNPPLDTARGRAVEALLRAYAAAAVGDGIDCHRQLERIAMCATELPVLREDFEDLRACFDPGGSADHDEALRQWLAGHGGPPPPRVHGLVFHARAARGDAVAAWVVRSGDGAARRVPELGIRFIVKEPPLATGRTQVRVETLLAVLATEARALPIDECFERVYGFAYQPVVHRGTFNVLVHRARERLGEGGSLERDGDHLHLWSDRLLVLPDPRCEPSLDERLLRYLAARGLSSTRDAASDLGVAVRTAQASLKRLTDDGACEMRRDGRHITYRLEDTTFLEPTTRF